jgi:hypothetical protein
LVNWWAYTWFSDRNNIKLLLDKRYLIVYNRFIKKGEESMRVGEQIDVSMKNICLYDLDDYYGKSILDKKVILFANDEGVIVEDFTRSGKLRDLLTDELLGDFFCDRHVTLIEKGDDVLLIDYEWDEDTRKAYARSLIPYYGGDDVEYSVIESDRTHFVAGRGYAGYMRMIDYVKDLSLDELIEIENDRLYSNDEFCWISYLDKEE